MKTHLHHLGLAVGDVGATVEALIAAFGAVRLPDPQVGHVLVRVGELHLALVSRREGDPLTRAWGDHLAFAVEADVRSLIVGRLAERGWQAQEVHGRIYVRNADGSLTLELLGA